MNYFKKIKIFGTNTLYNIFVKQLYKKVIQKLLYILTHIILIFIILYFYSKFNGITFILLE